MRKRSQLSKRMRPEQRILQSGPEALSDVDLLAAFIGSGIKDASAKQIARKLLAKFQSGLLSVEPQELTSIQGIGEIKAAKLSAIFELAARLATGLSQEQLASVRCLLKESGQQLTFAELLRWHVHPKPSVPEATFVDVFAGIGGIRLAFEAAGGSCLWSCEWDKAAQKTYEANFGEIPFGNISEITGADRSDTVVASTIPDHDILAAGFPCQPFSLAGVSKKNSLGKKHGFNDPTQGTLFFDLKRILQIKRPAAFFFENVKHLLHHDKGQTWAIIERTLQDELGYIVRWAIVDAVKWVPQGRKRIFIVGYNPDIVRISPEEIIIPQEPPPDYKYPMLNRIIRRHEAPKYMLGPGTWATLERHKKHHAASGNGFGYGMLTFPIPDGQHTRTISARYHKDGAEILVQTEGPRPRKLSIDEACQLQGFDPRTFQFPVSDTQAYRQIGNSVAIPAVETTAREIVKVLRRRRR